LGRTWSCPVTFGVVVRGVQWDVPEATGWAASALDDDSVVFDDLDVIFGEYCNAVIITQFSNRDEGP
jgi:hypothetical protein